MRFRITRLMMTICLCALCLLSSEGWAHEERVVNQYRPVFIPAYMPDSSLMYLAIRAFNDAAQREKFLIVNTKTLATEIVLGSALKFRRSHSGDNGYISESHIKNSPYMSLLERYTSPPFELENQGLKRGQWEYLHSAFMSVDLCPSVKTFEKIFFKRLAEIEASRTDQGVPVAISVSGLWMLAHPDEFDWLAQRRKLNQLDITWVNHSFSHLYFSDLPHDENFLNWGGTSIEAELLNVERLLIINGETPSIFVRMPGLVANEKVIGVVKRLGLVPLGADAWLGKSEQVQNSSIVLVHGNGNEPEGIQKALSLLTDWQWLGLRAAMIESPSVVIGPALNP